MSVLLEVAKNLQMLIELLDNSGMRYTVQDLTEGQFPGVQVMLLDSEGQYLDDVIWRYNLSEGWRLGKLEVYNDGDSYGFQSAYQVFMTWVQMYQNL